MADQHAAEAMPSFLAHIRNENGQLIAHVLDEHLAEVSRIAAVFAADFKAAEWAHWPVCGTTWESIGRGFSAISASAAIPTRTSREKSPGPTRRIRLPGPFGRSSISQAFEKRAGPVVARVMAYLIAGHHAGLDNWFGGFEGAFCQRRYLRELVDTLAAGPPQNILYLRAPLPDIAAIPAEHHAGIPGRFALWVRMLFSCLVDADFLDTEAFMSPNKAEARVGFLSLAAMETALQVSLAAMTRQVAARGEADSRVNGKRAEVLRACLEKAERPPGAFSLSVPTGGGKTLSSLAFALRHAVCHGKKRVIYAIHNEHHRTDGGSLSRYLWRRKRHRTPLQRRVGAARRNDTIAARVRELGRPSSSSPPTYNCSKACLRERPRVAASCTIWSIASSFSTRHSCSGALSSADC